MNLYLLMIIIFALINIKVFIKNSNTEYLSKENTSCIKGIFILIVLYSHMATYFDVQYSKDFLMYNFRNFLGQLMVTLFLFYSGYGIFESIKLKREKYINGLPVNRILKTWMKFAIAITCFLILSLFLQKGYGIGKILLSYVAWDSIGNSNWYIFSIIWMYILTFISFKIFKNNDKNAIILNLLLTLAYIIILNMFKGEYWFNTVLCYNFGLFYSLYKEKINKLLFKNWKYFLITIITAIVFVLFKSLVTNFLYYEIYSIIFSLLVVLLSVKVRFKSFILKWFGDNLFWVYILQRIPMIYFKEIGLSVHAYRYALVVFVSTIILTYLFKTIFDKPVNKLCNKILEVCKNS